MEEDYVMIPGSGTKMIIRDVKKEIETAFLDYSMSVIVARALPDVRDGLKPVHRRILYTMHERGNDPSHPYRKSADTVGAVLGSYHPHGDASVYDAMVRLAQDFSLRYPLVDGQGNFGSVDGDPPAAYRYTEARMSRMALKLMQQIHDFAQRDLVCYRHTAVMTIRFQNGLHAVEFAMLLLAFQQVKHTFHEVIDVQQLQLGATVVDGELFIVGDCPAEGGHGTVVLRAAVSHQVWEAIDRYLCACLLGIVKEQFFACLLTATILAVAEASSQSSLNGRGQHNSCLVVVLFQAVQQVRGKAKIALHEVLRVLRTVHASQIEHEVCLLAILVQFVRSGVQVVFIDSVNMKFRSGFVLTVPDVFQVVHKGGSYHALGTCYQNVHFFTSGYTAVQSGTSAPSGAVALLQIVTLLPMRTYFPTFAPVRITLLV